jgi:hypothetical protein
VLGALGVAGLLVPAAATSAGTASTCEVTVAPGAVADLQDALSGPDLGCSLWTVRVSGTYTLETSLTWVPSVPLRIVGLSTTTARIEADITDGPGHRLLTVEPIATPGPVTLERLVLAGGDVREVSVPGPDAPFDREGGAVLADDLILIDVELIDNHASVGGAVSTTDLVAVRTSFVGNSAEVGDPAEGAAVGGAVVAYGHVELDNVTFAGNVAGSGGAVHLVGDDPAGSSQPTTRLSATFVTFVANAATASGSGSHLHVDGRAVIALRGVLFGPLAVAPPVAAVGPACAGAALTSQWSTWVASFGVDETCGEGDDGDLAGLAFVTVPFLAGTKPLLVPDGDWPGRDAVACDEDWPVEDQRGVERPQGDAGLCDAGAVERQAAVEQELTEQELDAQEGEQDVEREVGSAEAGPDLPGPVPTGVPAGDGACADGCPTSGHVR